MRIILEIISCMCVGVYGAICTHSWAFASSLNGQMKQKQIKENNTRAREFQWEKHKRIFNL